MAAIGSTAFGVLLWGSILGTFAVFCYEVYVLLGEFGVLGRG